MKYSTIEKTRQSTGFGVSEQTRKSGKNRFRKIKLLVRILFWVGIFWFLNYGKPFIVQDVQIDASDSVIKTKNPAAYQTADLIGMNVFYLPLKSVAEYIKSDPAVESVKISYWPLRKLTLRLEYAEPVASMAKPSGFYILGENGQYLGTLPVYASVYLPIKFESESVLFYPDGKPRKNPWQETLANSNLNDAELMSALGFRDLMKLRDLIIDQAAFPEVQYIGYDERYGLALKCVRKPLILLGYGNNLFLQFEKARKFLIYPEKEFNEDKYIDLRFDRFQSAKNIDNLDGLFD